ncbi:uncharacterized protein KZ484_016322 [Pholidichthys leucotaenia]
MHLLHFSAGSLGCYLLSGVSPGLLCAHLPCHHHFISNCRRPVRHLSQCSCAILFRREAHRCYLLSGVSPGLLCAHLPRHLHFISDCRQSLVRHLSQCSCAILFRREAHRCVLYLESDGFLLRRSFLAVNKIHIELVTLCLIVLPLVLLPARELSNYNQS